MRPPNRPLFVARESYRRSRIIDAIKLVPVLGALLFLVPVLNVFSGSGTTISGGLYLFLSWFGLIGLSAYLARRVRQKGAVSDDDAKATLDKDAG